jgi:predicted phosphodiesterase
MASVLVIGDCHCPGMRQGYVDFLKRVADDYGVNRVVHIGDLVDWASISFHEKSPALSNATREFENAKRQVAALARAFPEADWLLGNHDALTERQAISVGLPMQVLRDYADLWEVSWTVHPRFAKLQIDGVIYSHGDSGRGGQDAALAQAKDQFRSTVIGHFHSQAGVKWWANPEFRIFGLSVGCGIDASRLQFEYGRRIVAKPVLGCGVVINGRRAFFEPWLLKSR